LVDRRVTPDRVASEERNRLWQESVFMKDTANTSRRDFLKKCVAGAIGASVGDLSLAQAAPNEIAGSKSRVVVARDANVYALSPTPDSSRVLKLLDQAMQRFYDTSDPITPWKRLVHPGEVVGLKVNTIAGPGLSSHPVLADAICERLKQAGVRPADIVIWDRTSEELERAGFRLSNQGNRERIIGTDAKEVGYEEKPSVYGSVHTRLSKLLTRTCGCMINVPVLKDHSGAGVTLAMKNMYGVIHNPNEFHDNNCCPYIADLNMMPAIKEKFRLVICDALTGCYEGGPGFKPQYAWRYNGLMVATDPVALDYTGWQIIERKRAGLGLKPLAEVGRPPKYIAIAADAQHRLGTDDPKRIAVVEI
jgi:uncharacterized protein (DUF362 family)